jgi:predicted HicB family RNase H-like nuclease
MAETKPGSTPALRTARIKISTRVAPEASRVLAAVAAQRRTSMSQVVRCVVEDAAQQLVRDLQAA